jgi:hypothetical protein
LPTLPRTKWECQAQKHTLMECMHTMLYAGYELEVVGQSSPSYDLFNYPS